MRLGCCALQDEEEQIVAPPKKSAKTMAAKPQQKQAPLKKASLESKRSLHGVLSGTAADGLVHRRRAFVVNWLARVHAQEYGGFGKFPAGVASTMCYSFPENTVHNNII